MVNWERSQHFSYKRVCNSLDIIANSKIDGAGVLKVITVLTLIIYLECTLVDLQPLTLSVQHIVVQHYQQNYL